MKTITDGTQKQNDWANDIIRTPINSVEKRIAEWAHYIELGYDDGYTTKIIASREAIAAYESRLQEYGATLTAKFVIEQRDNFSRLMRSMLCAAYKRAGLKVPVNF